MDTLVLDFETYYDRKFSLTKLTTMEYVADPRFKVWGLGYRWLSDDETTWLGEDEVQDFIDEVDWSKTHIVCHNTLFDGYVLTQHYGVTPAYYYDTAAMARGDSPGLPASLKATCERLFPLDESMRKGDELVTALGMEDLDPETEEAIARYCRQDVDLTYEIFARLVRRYPQPELDLIHLTTKMFCEPVLLLDRKRLITYHQQQVTNSQQLIEASGLDRKVLASNQQFATALVELGITPPTKKSPTTGKWIPALGKKDPAWLQMCRMYPEHKHIWDARLAAKSRIAETRAQRFLDVATESDHMPMPLRYYAAHTGRFGGTEKINVQNMPRGSELRKSLIAPDGYQVCVADLSQIEVRMLAWLAGQDNLLDSFRNNEDIYSVFASEVYRRPIDKDKDPTERFVGKTAVLGLGYGMGAEKFAQTIRTGAMGPPMDISDSDAFNAVTTYRKTYARVPALWKQLENLMLKMQNPSQFGDTYGPLEVRRHKLVLPNGMSLKYHNLQGTTFFNGKFDETLYGGKLTENVVQALARIVITDAMLRVWDFLDESNRGRIVLTVHDEIVVVAREEDACNTLETMIDLMCIPPQWAPDLPLAAEGGYDKAYSK